MLRSIAISWSSRRVGILAALVVSLGATQAFGQAVDIPAVLDSDLKLPPTVVTAQYGHQFETDVEDGGDSKMVRDTAFIGLAHRVKLAERTTMFIIGNYTLHAYDFGGGKSTTIGAQNPYQWDRVHRGVLGGMFGHDVNDRWRILGGPFVRTWGETGADFGDTITAGLIGGFDYHTSEDFSIGLLVGAISKLEGGAAVIPIPTLKWKFAESWRLNVGMVQLVDPGVGAQLNYQITPELGLGGGFSFQSREFRLSGARRAEASDPGRSRQDDTGVGYETEFPIFATLRWKPTPKIELDLNGGVAVRGNLRVEDNNGDRLADSNYDPAGLLAFKAQFFF